MKKKKNWKNRNSCKTRMPQAMNITKKKGKSNYRKLGGCDQNQPLIQFKFKNTH